MGTIDSIADRFETDIEVVTDPHKVTGMWDRQLSTVGGGAMTCVGGDKRQIRVFHDYVTHGAFVVQVDKDIEIRIERRSKSEMIVRFERLGDVIGGERRLTLELDVPQTIQDPRGRTMTFRRFRHPEHLLRDLFDRVHA